MGAPLAFVLVAAGVAAWFAWQAARDTNFWERSFWRLLAAASAAQGLGALIALGSGHGPLAIAARVADDTHVVLSAVALLVRPDRPRDAGERRAATLEWLMAVVAGYFLAFYFNGAPLESRRAWPEAAPALVALALASRVRPPFFRVYGFLALGFCASAALGAWPFSREVAPMPALLGVMAAAQLSRRQDWVRPAWDGATSRPHWLASLAVVLPSLVELGSRMAESRPDVFDARSTLTLASTLLLMILAAMRVHPRAIVLPSAEPREAEEHVSAADSLEFASRVAHELNNPLMAVAGLAELALKKGAPEAPLRRLIDGTGTASEIVTRLHQITGRSKGVAG